MSQTVAVLGAGSFGTALAKLLAEGGHRVQVYTRDVDVADVINREHRHPKRLKTVRLPAGLKANTDLASTLQDATLVVVAVPTPAVRSVMTAALPHAPADALVLSAAKGIEQGSLRLVHDILEEVFPAERHHRLCYLSGPSFALEMAKRMPTAVTIASRDDNSAREAQEIVSTDYFRAYTTTDVIGVEVGGAVKNVVAIAAGISEGLGLGLNASAALITRGLAEITRLAVKMGAQPMTLAGLAGMGDLVLTCNGALSRNRTVGVELGRGKKLPEILQSLGEVAEGVNTSKALDDLAKRVGVELPIAQCVHRILFSNADPRDELYNLMGRQLKSEVR